MTVALGLVTVQAGGRTMGQAFQAFTTLVAALVISFRANVYLTLVILALIPFIVMAGYLQMKTLAGHEHANKDRLQEAGKVGLAWKMVYVCAAHILSDHNISYMYGIFSSCKLSPLLGA